MKLLLLKSGLRNLTLSTSKIRDLENGELELVQ